MSHHVASSQLDESSLLRGGGGDSVLDKTGKKFAIFVFGMGKKFGFLAKIVTLFDDVYNNTHKG